MQTVRLRWIRTGIAAGAAAALASVILFILLTGAALTDVIPGVIWYFAGAGAAGALYGWLLAGAQPLKLGESVIWGVVYGALNWVVLGVMIVPVLGGMDPQWSPAAVAAQFPLLMLYLIQGVVLALIVLALVTAGYLRRLVAPTADALPAPAIRRVVILGGGFAGVTAAQELEKKLGEDRSVQITLISRANHLLFTPMLAEVTAGGVEAQHISPPLRAFFRRVDVIKGEPTAIDLAARTVTAQAGTGALITMAYDHLVLALGAVPNFYGNANLERHSFTFKSLTDAIRIRTHVIETLERADSEPDPDRRRALLTFVVVGAGFAGAELIGGLNDFVRGSLWYYKHIPNDEIAMLLVHPGELILPELSPELARYAQQKMTARGVTIMGGVRATDATAASVTIGDQIIPTATLIWTAGNLPNPFAKSIGLETDKRGAALVDEMLRAHGQSHVWAVGDGAAVPDVITGKTAPPTAQYALRQGKALAHNLHAALTGSAPAPFKHRSQGSLAVVGHQTAVAEVFGFKFSGLFAWLMWRGIYLIKLPTLEKRVRVLLDWILDVFFPRDIAYTPERDAQAETMPAGGD